MSPRTIEVIVVCEDSQHEAFLRRALGGLGYHRRKIRVEKSPSGRGAADAWVLQRLPALLRVYRQRQVEHVVILMMDVDRSSLKERQQQLDDICRAQGVDPRAPDERVAVLLPGRNIETWLAYLNGKDVDETSAYAKLRFAGDYQLHVDALLDGCQRGQLREPVPPSLAHACQEYHARIRR